jgi:hypothetical protein
MPGTVEPSKPDLVLDPTKKRLARGPIIFFLSLIGLITCHES